MATSQAPTTPAADLSQGVFKISGKGYPERWADSKIPYKAGRTVKEILALGHAENEVALVRAFYGQFNIRGSKGVKEIAAKTDSTVAQISSYLQSFQIKAEKQKGGGKGGNPEALAAARATREAQKEAKKQVDSMKEAAAANPEIARKLAELQALMAGAKK